MNNRRRILLRAADRIRDRLIANEALASLEPVPEQTWERCAVLASQYQMARSRGWTEAAATVRDRYQSNFNRLVDQLRELQSQAHESERRNAPSLKSIYEELTAIDQEFENLRIDFEESVLAVTTDRIVLEEIDLGPFEVRLHWNRMEQRHCYTVVALTPNPPSGDDDVTHPHVRSDALCEGEGRLPIAQALRDGRLHDFFSIVNRILHTYSASSPYVALDQWSGVSCADCGSMSDVEEAARCSHCSDNLCLDCRTYCERCECDFCHGCIGNCSGCDVPLCRDCQISCTGCGKRCCGDCVSDSEHCEDCQNDQQAELEGSHDDEVTDPASAPTAARATFEEGTPALPSH